MNEQSSGAPVAPVAQKALTSPSALLKNAWALYTKHFNALVPILLIGGIGMYLQSLVMFMYGKDDTSGMYSILILISAVIYLIGMIWGMAAVFNRVSKLDQPMTVGQAFTAAKPYVWPFFLTALIAGIFTVIGFILVIIPGIIVAVWLTFSVYIVFNENKSGMDAIKASKAYVQGYWWPVFGRLVVITLVLIIISMIVGTLSYSIAGNEFGQLIQNIVGLIITPLAVLYQYDLYKNIRAVKGGGVPGGNVLTPTPAD